MILFKKDWSRYPTAIVDTSTSNASFLAMADRYRQMGISNYYFMLALHNPTLKGINPFDPELSVETKLAIADECRTNPWYFIREVARLPPISGIEPMRYIANRGNIAAYWLFFNHITHVLIQPRQTGKSGSIDVLSEWIIDIATVHTKMLMLTKDAALQSDAISRIKGIRDLLPKYLYSRSRNDMDNKTGLDNKALYNEYKTGVARQNKLAANNLGRGMTTAIVHIDEPPFITHIGTTFPAAQAAGTKARLEAKKNGALYGTILTTTAGRRDDRDGGYMYELVSNAWVWNETIFDCVDEADAVKLVDRGCKGKMVIADVTMSHRQLGYTDKWLYEAIRATGGTREEMERDFLNRWNSGSSRSPLSVEIIQHIAASVIDPKMTEVTEDNYTIRWYVTEAELSHLKVHSKLAMGLDSSEAAGRDAIAMEIIDLSTLQVVGAATVGISNLIEYAKWLARFMIEHEEIVLIPERKSTGAMIIDMLLILLPQAGIDPFKRIFNSIVDEAHQSRKGEDAYSMLHTPMTSRDSFFYTERKTSFGFKTDATRRGLLFGNVLQQAAKQTCRSIHDKPLADELMGLTEKNGRIDHTTLGHDDHVVAWLLAHWLATHAMNLSHYGIKPGLVMSAVIDEDEDERSTVDRWKEGVQKHHMEEIEQLIAQLSDCENETMTALYERRLQYLSRRVEASGKIKDFSVDGIMERVRKERDKRLRLGMAMGTSDPDQQLRDELQNVIADRSQQIFRHGRRSFF